MENILAEAVRLLEDGQCFVMASIIDGSGSIPRSAGTKMIINKDGSIFATIGGGKLEAEAMEKAREVLAGKKPSLYSFNLSGEDAAGSDMICGGTGSILLDYVSGDDLAVYKAAQELRESGQKGWLTTVLDFRQNEIKRQFGLVTKGGSRIVGSFEPGTEIWERLSDAAGGPGMHTEEIDGVLYITEQIHRDSVVYLFGAGHVAREVAKVAAIAGFKTIVYDNRSEFANKERFPDSDCRILASFDDLPGLSLDKDSYIVIVTRGHLYDKNCLQWALKTQAGYIGMIGSRRKRDLIYAQLRREGVAPVDLERVFSPIGIEIGAETPSEIAVSIVAEMIKVRARKNEK